MRKALLLLFAALLLPACVRSVDVGGDANAVSPAGSGVAFGFHTLKTHPPLRWTVTIARVLASGRVDASDPATIRHPTIGFGATESDFAYFNLAPGEYAVVSLVPFTAQAQFHQPTSGADVRNATFTHGPLGLGMTGLMIAGERLREAREEAHFGPRKQSELVFVDGGQLSDEAPRFTVRAGNVTYIGDFLLGARRFEVVMQGVAGGTSAFPGDSDERTYWYAPVAAHAYDEATAQQKLATLGILRARVWTAELPTLDGSLRHYDPSFDRERAEFRAASRGKIKILGENVALPASMSSASVTAPEPVTATQAVPTPSAPLPRQETQPLSALPIAEIQRMFLAGEIDVQEYQKARAGR